MVLDTKQTAVVRSGSLAVLIVVVACGLSFLIPPTALPADDAISRIAWALLWMTVPMLALMVSVVRVANHRFVTPEDIDGSGLTVGSARVQVLRAVLQNTLEQSVLAAGAYLIGAIALPHDWLRIIPPAAVLFAVGRILFAFGYDRGAAGRALGFGLTAYPTFGLLGTIAILLAGRLARWLLP
jgi:hypothetical protein